MIHITSAVAAALLIGSSLVFHTSARGQGQDELWTLGAAAYKKKDYVDALKYFFAYKILVGEKLDSDAASKKELTNAIAYSERMLRASVLIGTSSVLSDKKIQIEGGFKVANPWAKFDTTTVVDVTKANALMLEK
ncbi:MAG: hypothetical protein V5B40_16000 [Candidatus Accumulibacter meliphilus]|jgi:hypothetical protein|uniref:hypothetical protein n=1 Tax=Candidatus Accumulibacter meliphilus TaxID=2211374 RepID=UPI002FC2D3F3